ncbi:MAG: glycosyltransferase family 2 protein [Proteobacteria bacterium]|nr:glycosyltransferase family 2 protein [Pseudomonadota bacterium]
MPRLSVIVPAYNEEATILETLARVKAQEIADIDIEVIVIDDGSTDATITKLEANPELYSRLVRMPKNGGKGAAVKAGLSEASGDYVLFQDADLEYDPDDYHKLVVPILRHDADLVIGSRMLAPTYTRVHYYWHKRANKMLSSLFNILHNTTFTDIYSCYLLYRRSLIDPAELRTVGWEQHAEILGLAVKRGKVYYEVPVTYSGRSYDEGKKIRAHHVWAVIAEIIRGRFR